MDNFIIKGRYLSSMTPQEIVLELLDKASANLLQAEHELSARRYEPFNRLLIATQNIFVELQGSIRGTGATALRTEDFLAGLADCLFYVNLNLDVALLREVADLTNRLRVVYAVELGKIRFE